MKRSTIGIAVAAGVAFCGVQVLGTVPALPTIGTEVVAHASDAKVVDSGTLGTCPWTLTADGVMHVGSGELPEAKAQYGSYVTPFFDINITEAGLGRKINTISFEGSVKTPVNASFLFSGFSDDAPQIKNWTELDTSNSTNFAYMFYGSNQDTVDVSSFDTSKATDMQGVSNFLCKWKSSPIS